MSIADQHILIGADEGLYTLNLNEIHENMMELVSRLCMYCLSLKSLSIVGKFCHFTKNIELLFLCSFVFIFGVI